MNVFMAFWGVNGFQFLLSEIVSQLELLHDFVMVWLTVIILSTVWVSFQLVKGPQGILLSSDSDILEQSWTFLPILILASIAFPSIYLLCMQDSFLTSPQATIKVIGSQWSWLTEDKVGENDHTFDVDQLENISAYENPTLFTQNCTTRLIIGSMDVLHSLGLPSLGVKLDATPGRLNATTVCSNFPGTASGSCFELCGSGHSVMPIYFVVM